MKHFKWLVLLLILSAKISSAQKSGLINSGEVINRGVTLYDSAKYKSALLVFNDVSRSDTNYVWSLYEKALTCEADSQYTQAIKYCQEALSLKEQREYEPDLYNTYGNILTDLGQPEKAIKLFDEAIARFPGYALLHFNKGVAYMSLKQYNDAEHAFQSALLVSPYMYSAHFQLALAALRQGKIIPAYLSFVGYLLVNPEGKYSSKSINYIDQITKSTDDILNYKGKRTTQPDENYQEIEDILSSKIELDKSYKSLISFDDPLSRSIQAVMEKVEYKPASNDFWVQYYVPYYKQVYTGGKFEPFIFHLFSNVQIAPVVDYKKKNRKLLDGFINEAATYFDLIRATRQLNYNSRDTVKLKYLFSDNKLAGKGTLSANGKILTGHWAAYYPAGNKKGNGNYNDAGERIGDWIYYTETGLLKAIERYKAGKLDGLQEYYYANGNYSSRENYVGGKAEGLVTTYYYGGNVKSTAYYKLGKKEGEEKKYYANGNLQEINNYNNDLLTGIAKEYFKSGPIKNISQYSLGKSEGPYKSYYEAGGISTEGMMSKDNAEGEWKFYYENGKLKEKRNYVNNSEEGLHQEYFETGELSGSYNTKKGKIIGEATYFYKDGKPFSTYEYDNGNVKSAKFVDHTGKPLYSAETQSKSINVINYNTDGIKKSHVYYNQKGDMDGPDTIYYASGKVNQVSVYKNGDEEGLMVTYYLNGHKKSEINMSAGKENGYYTSFHANGKPESEGWMQDGESQGEWIFYNEQGKVTSKSNYLDGDFNGYKESYSPDGKKSTEEKYHLGWLEKLTQYDTTGNVIAVDTFPKSTGKYTLRYPNGKIMIQADYVNGDFNGPYKSYYFDGSIEMDRYYKNGLPDSIYTDYYYGGKKSSEGKFVNGNKTGVWKSYDEDGKLYSTGNYVADQLNGEKVYYFPEGGKDYVAQYKDDMLNGDAKKYDPDGSFAYQVNFEDDNPKATSYFDKDGKLVAPLPIPFTHVDMKGYFANGKLSRECEYVDGIKNGRDIIYFSNGQPRSLDTLYYGLTQGIGKEYYPSGKLKSQYNYVNDNVDGTCKDFYENGTVKKEAIYANGENNGPTRFYNENGKLVKTMWYYYGKLLSVKSE